MDALPSTVTLVDHPIVRLGLTVMRDKTSSVESFRGALRRATLLLVAEAMRSVGTDAFDLQTPIARATGHRLSRPVVVVPILRAGLGMAEAVLTLLPDARVGHVGLFRDEATFEPQSYYFKVPPLAGADVMMVDPMLATGQSAADAVDRVLAAGAGEVMLLSLIAASKGVAHFAARHPNVRVYVGAVDRDLNDKAYIVPGLGDAGDRYFGT